MKQVRIFPLLLAVLMTAGMLCACGQTVSPTEPPAPAGVKLWHGYNTENFMQEIQYPEKMDERDFTLRMYGIRGDVESVQLLITPDHYVEEYFFEVDDLLTASGDKIKKSNIEVLSQLYTYVEDSMYNDTYDGFYPDALVPVKAVRRERSNYIRANENQGIWFNVTIPEDAAPGFYTCTGKLELDDEEYDIPIELTVYDVVMPETVHAKSCFLIWYDYIAKGEDIYTSQLGEAYYQFLVDKRMMPMYPIPQISNDYEAFVDFAVQNLAENPKISCYALPKAWDSVEAGSVVSRDATMRLLTMMAEKNVALRQAGNETIDLFKKAYYYTHDEPTGNTLTCVAISDQIISECKFAVADEYLKDYPDLYDSLTGLSHLVTTGYNEDLLGTDTKGGLQTWCPQFQHWHTQEQRQQYWERQNTTDRRMGEDAWWYGCNNPSRPFPTYHLDDDIIAARVLGWMQYDYRCDGNLYWCVNNYSKNTWEEPPNFGGSIGEGQLVYPGKRFDYTEPLSTLRLESIREGVEDYEYFWMIEDAITRYNQDNGTAYDPRALMAPLYEGLYDGMIPVRDNSVPFQQRRIEVLELLVQFGSDPAGAISALESMQAS